MKRGQHLLITEAIKMETTAQDPFILILTIIKLKSSNFEYYGKKALPLIEVKHPLVKNV